MHRVNGRRVVAIDAPAVAAWAAGFAEVTVDLGTGDGRFVRRLAAKQPLAAAIGIDTCQANVRRASQAAPDNALFLVADALSLPRGWDGLASRVTVNFPWGSLLRGLVAGDNGLLDGLRALSRSGATLEMMVNGGALAEVGLPLDDGAERMTAALRLAGWTTRPAQRVTADELRRYPTTWAKRLAFGRDPRAVRVVAQFA